MLAQAYWACRRCRNWEWSTTPICGKCKAKPPAVVGWYKAGHGFVPQPRGRARRKKASSAARLAADAVRSAAQVARAAGPAPLPTLLEVDETIDDSMDIDMGDTREALVAKLRQLEEAQKHLVAAGLS
eukprot:184352-Amphidinium_carterae.1